MAYYQATNTGAGFITHEDNELSHVAGYSSNIWITENTSWAARVGAIAKTKAEAQALIDADLIGKVYPEGHEKAGEPVTFILP